MGNGWKPKDKIFRQRQRSLAHNNIAHTWQREATQQTQMLGGSPRTVIEQSLGELGWTHAWMVRKVTSSNRRNATLL